MKPDELALYRDLLGDIKSRVRNAQHRAALSANAEMLRLYWDIGRMIASRQEAEGWGKALLTRLAVDLRNEIPEVKGFSERNLQLMIQFQNEYPGLFPIPQRPVAQLPDSRNTEKVPRVVAQLPLGQDSETFAPAMSPIAQRAVAQLRAPGSRLHIAHSR